MRDPRYGLAFTALSALLLTLPASTAPAASGRPIHEGIDAALVLLEEAGRLVEAGERDEAVGLFDQAVDEDPWLAQAWANRGIQAQRLGRIGPARLAYRMALELDPDIPAAARGLELLADLPGEKSAPELFEDALGRGLSDEVSARRLARAWTREGRPLRAAALLEMSRARGATGLEGPLAEAYAAAGWHRDALRAAESAVDPEARPDDALREAARASGKRAAAMLRGIAADLTGVDERGRSMVEDVAHRLGAVRDVHEGHARLLRFLSRRRGLTLRAAALELPIGRRWYRVEAPEGDGRAPDDTLRRWPGDTQIAAWARAPAPEGSIGYAEIEMLVPGLTLSAPPRPVGLGLPPRPVLRAEATLVLGESGAAPATLWVVPSRPGDTETILVALYGDGGAGQEGYARARAEVEAALSWARDGRGDVVGGEPFHLPVPADLLPVDAEPPPDERTAPWRTVDAGSTLLDVPPGVVGRGITGQGPVPPGLRDGTVAWFRGRFVDREGTPVVVGDVETHGYLDIWRSDDAVGTVGRWIGEEALAKGEDRLRGDPGARRVRGIDYLDAAGPPTGAEQVSLARFRGGSFGGSWLAARLRYGDVVAEIGVPLAAGESSLAAFWIPTTLRAKGAPAPPPPIDLTARYNITFVAATREDRGLLAVKAGDLVADELRMMVPAGWRVALSSRAARGFPVRLRPDKGGAVIVIDRLPGTPAELRDRRAAALADGSEEVAVSWTAVSRPGRFRAEEGLEASLEWTTGDERLRGKVLLLRPKGGRADFVLRAEAPLAEWDDNFTKTVDLAFGSLRFRKIRKN